MKLQRKLSVLASAVGLLLIFITRSPAEEIGDRFIDLVRAGKPVATIVASDEKAPIWDDAVAMIAATVKRWSGVPPKVVRLAKDAPLPKGEVILLATPETHSSVGVLTQFSQFLPQFSQWQIGRLPFVDEHGFAILSRGELAVEDVRSPRRLIIAGKTPRGVYNGAVYCRDFLLDATPGAAGKVDVFVRRANVVRSPQMSARGTYLLSIYGVAMKYTAEDWMRIIDRYAEDGMERVYFWLSGHHPSKKYPHLFNVDATKDTKLTVDGVRRLIRYCHDRGIKFYIGGGVFAWVASHYLIKDHPEIAAVKAGGLCPSKPFARTGNRDHFLEMYETWPEADGFMFEIRDEHGQCQCVDCQKKLDEFGSMAYGRAEITWLQEFAWRAWKRNPKLHFCWLIGYAEHHKDVEYYDQIRRMNDPRFEWLDTRVGLDLKGPWRLPGANGEPRPFAFFSRRIAHWDQFYKLSLEGLHKAARRTADEGLVGYVPAFEPGFGSASYYSEEIPLPVNILPYCLTGLVYREMTWDPGLSLDELKRRIHRRYFSPDAPKRLTDDLIYLRQFSIDHWQEIMMHAKPRRWYDGSLLPQLTVESERKRVRSIPDAKQRQVEAARLRKTFDKLASVGRELKRMDEIQTALKKAKANATPKTQEGLVLLQRLIEDTRRLYQVAVPDTKLLSEPIE